jgi:hypothetical protein
MKNIKLLLIFLIITSTFSCKSDDEMNLSDNLVGEWLRNDFSDDFEFKLIFQSDNSGLRIYREGNMETEITSSAIQFNWSTDKNTLTFSESDEIITTKYSFNSDGQLILTDYSDLPFIRIE